MLELSRRLRGVREPATRVAVLAEIAATSDADDFVVSLDELGRAALNRDPDASELVLSLLVPTRVFIDPLRISELSEIASESGRVVALQWLWAAREARIASTERLGLVPQTLVDRSLASMTLGDRRALARRAGVDQLARLFGDPDPVVVTHVLANARTTEAMVLTMCAKRPTVTAALQTVIDSVPWVRRPRVRIALAHNPYLAVYAAVPLLVTLPHVEVAGIRDDEALEGSLRLAASRLLVAQG